MRLKKVYSVFAIAMALALTLTACGNSNPSTGTQTGTPNQAEAPAAPQEEVIEEDTRYPIVIDHAFGQTILETKPERVATISWGNQDVPLALGVVPVGISEVNYTVSNGKHLFPWTEAKFKELGVENPVLFKDTAGLDYEGISDAQPDVILAAYSGLTQEEYDLLSEIAPVVAYPTLPWETFWRDQILMSATGMGMKLEGEALVSEIEDLLAQKTRQYPQILGKSVACFYFNEADLGKFYIYLPNDPRVAFLTDLGMVNPESVARLGIESNGCTLELSAENIDLIEDIEIIISYGSDTLLEALQKDPLIGTLPAVQRGSVAIITDGTPLAASAVPTALSIPATIDEYLSIIAKAADQVE
jgi:iron complex transport system substrate-binding protein